MDLGKDSTNCWIVAWTDNASSSWSFKADLREKIQMALRDLGVKTQSFQISQSSPPITHTI